MAEPKDTKVHRALQYLITLPILFSTYMLGDMYSDWKAHLKEFGDMKTTVAVHEEKIEAQTTSYNIVTGNVESLSKEINKWERRFNGVEE